MHAVATRISKQPGSLDYPASADQPVHGFEPESRAELRGGDGDRSPSIIVSGRNRATQNPVKSSPGVLNDVPSYYRGCPAQPVLLRSIPFFCSGCGKERKERDAPFFKTGPGHSGILREGRSFRCGNELSPPFTGSCPKLPEEAGKNSSKQDLMQI
jgi:hypothetical protein